MTTKSALDLVFRNRSTDFIFNPLAEYERMRVHYVTFCRNGSGNGAGYWRVFASWKDENERKPRRMLIHLFDKDTPSKTRQFHDTHGTMVTVVDLDNPLHQWKPDVFMPGVTEVIRLYRRDHHWPLTPESPT
jgi:hypothetical protein